MGDGQLYFMGAGYMIIGLLALVYAVAPLVLYFIYTRLGKIEAQALYTNQLLYAILVEVQRRPAGQPDGQAIAAVAASSPHAATVDPPRFSSLG